MLNLLNLELAVETGEDVGLLELIETIDPVEPADPVDPEESVEPEEPVVENEISMTETPKKGWNVSNSVVDGVVPVDATKKDILRFEEGFLIFLLVKSPMMASRAAVRSVAAVSSFSFSFKRSALSSSEQTVTVVFDIVNATS